jgi:hypothetical protein
LAAAVRADQQIMQPRSPSSSMGALRLLAHPEARMTCDYLIVGA